MKTTKEIEELKHNWTCDPCWDIYSTEGFEDHVSELKEYQNYMEDLWFRQREEKIKFEMLNKGITDRKTFDYLKNLEHLIDKLDERILKLENRL